MAVTAHRAVNHVDEVRVSEGTRNMARPNNHEVLSVYQEYQELLVEKKDIEAALSTFKTRMLKEQKRIRARGSDASTLNAWLKRREELEDERTRMVNRKAAIETRAMHIKSRAMEGKQLVIEDPRDRYMVMMVQELRAIRQLLESQSPSTDNGA